MSEDNRTYRQFIWSNVLRGIIWIGGIIGLYLVLDTYLPASVTAYMDPLTESPPLMFVVFFLSETLFGIIPLEFFVIWAKKYTLALGPYTLFILLLAVLSFLGGLIAYILGSRVKEFPFLQRISQWESFVRYEKVFRRFGGIVIVLSALTPIPYATISFLSATFRFPFQRYLLFASTRFLRFAIQGTFLWLLK